VGDVAFVDKSAFVSIHSHLIPIISIFLGVSTVPVGTAHGSSSRLPVSGPGRLPASATIGPPRQSASTHHGDFLLLCTLSFTLSPFLQVSR
jgi:hypothetical protein